MNVKPNHYERQPVWVPFTAEQSRAMMGKDYETRMAAYRKLCGIVEPKRKGMK